MDAVAVNLLPRFRMKAPAIDNGGRLFLQN
jgi:hypothetical protein